MTKNPFAEKDRLTPYLKKYLKEDFLFGEFSDAFLARPEFEREAMSEAAAEETGADATAADGGGQPLRTVLKDVSIPLRKEDLKDFAADKGLAPDKLCDNMIWVLGCDPAFPHRDAYLSYIRTLFDTKKLVEGLLATAEGELEKEEFDSALAHARGALVLDPENREALYGYALTTHECYSNLEGEEDGELVGRLKADSLDYLEELTAGYPDFAPGWYHLGYGYANLGLYRKAELSWRKFLGLTEDLAEEKIEDFAEERKEIRERLAEIRDPVAIEDGINDVQAGRYDRAVTKLEPFLSGKFAEWWPLHYFLGLAQVELGELTKAKEHFLTALRLNPSHVETMKELSSLYTVEGDTENAEKYRRKAELVAGQEN